MADNVVCGVCGGREFVKEAGFYYCVECQTQTCEIREQEYELEETMIGVHRSRTTISRSEAATGSSSKQASELASWEVFNYILAGLTGELVQLGAPSELHEVTRLMWFEYLRGLGIISERKEARPQLGLAGRTRDERIVYNRKRKRRIRSRASSISGDDIKSQRKLLARNKRALVRAEYERESRTGSRSLTDVTLSEVSSGSDSESQQMPRYNCAATRALKLARKRGCVLHNTSYWQGVWALRRDKLYAVLCLAAQIASTDGATWLPGDVLRAIRDGHLSFLSYGHLLPEGGDQMPATRGSQRPPSHFGLRKAMKQFADLFHIKLRTFTPDMATIVTRYCRELNLPDEIRSMAVNLVNDVGDMFQRNSYIYYPNYEGRAMAFILYILKLLFCLDGQTELQLSQLAQHINQTTGDSMFVFGSWLRHIEYRRILLAHKHFPTAFQLQSDTNSTSNQFTNFLRQQRSDENPDKNLTKEIVKEVLNNLEIYENCNVLNNLDFQFDRCSISANLDTILQKADEILINGQSLQRNLLSDFSKNNLDYVFNYNKYLQKLYQNYAVVREGARSNCIYMGLNYSTGSEIQERWEKTFQNNKLEYLYVDELENFVLNKKLKPTTSKIKPNVVDVKKLLRNKTTKESIGRDEKGRFCPKNCPQAREDENYHNQRKRGKYFVSSWTDNPVLHKQTYNTLYTATQGRTLHKTAEKLLKHKRSRKDSVTREYVHHVAHSEYWMLCVAPLEYCVTPIPKSEWRRLRKFLPPTFTAVLSECARVCEHTERHLYQEFALVEMYINYVHLALPTSAQDISKIVPTLIPSW